MPSNKTKSVLMQCAGFIQTGWPTVHLTSNHDDVPASIEVDPSIESVDNEVANAYVEFSSMGAGLLGGF